MQTKPNRTAVWCIALTVAIVLDQWKHLFPGQYTLLAGAEPVRQAYSWFTFWRRSMLSGDWPLWDPNAWGGYAFPGEMQTAAFYPLYLLLLPFHPNHFGLFPVPLFSAMFITAHIVAALGMFAFVRHLRATHLAAFVAGFAFSSASFTGAVTWPHMLESAIWLPYIALFLFRSLESSQQTIRIRNALLAGLFLGLSLLAGGLHVAIAQMIFIASASAYFALTTSTALVNRKSAFVGCAITASVVLVAGMGVAAIQLFPSHVYAKHALRAMGGVSFPATTKVPYTFLTHDALSPRALMTFLFPTFEGIGLGEIWTPYVGVVPFLFAALAVVKLWSKRWVPYLSGLGVAAFLYSLAGTSALHGVLYLLAPLLWMAREATRFIYLTGFCLCVLAAFGLDYFRSTVVEKDLLRKLKRASSAAIYICLAIFLGSVFFPKIGGYWEFFSLLVITMTCGLLRYAVVRPAFKAGPLFAAFLISLLFFDLNAYNWTGTNKLEGPNAGTEDIDILNSLKGVADYFHRQAPPFRVKVDYEPEPNIGDAYGIPSLSGGGVTMDRYAWKALPWTNLLNVKYLVRPASFAAAGAVYTDAHWKVYPNPDAFPHFWIVHRFQVDSDEDSMYNDARNRQSELRSIAFLANAPGAPVEIASHREPDVVQLLSYSARDIRLAVKTSAPGLLVLSELFYPEWHATVNGREAAIVRADQALRSIPVPAGQSTVEFIYRPTSVYIGGIISAVSALVIAVFVWGTRVSSRRRDRTLNHEPVPASRLE